MNTMYRNEMVNKGYDQVKGVFQSKTPEIMSKDTKGDWPKIIERLCEDDEGIRTKLDQAVEKITDKGWPDAKKILDEDDGKGRMPFDYMPKALLHVHNKVGLSVDQLFELFGEINQEASCDDYKIGFVVKTEGGAETVIQVMYKKQFREKYGESPTDVAFKEYTETDVQYKKYFRFDNKPDKRTAWAEFGQYYFRIEPPFHIEEFYRKYHEKLFAECINNNIKYAELRVGFEELVKLEQWSPRMLTSFRAGFRMEDYFYHRDMMLSATPDAPKAEFLKVILEAAQANSKIEVKVILTANRNISPSEEIETAKKKICEKLDTAIAIKNGMANVGDEAKNTAIAEMVIGFDLVNQEKEGEGLTDQYASILYDNFGKEYDGKKYHKYWESNPPIIDQLETKKRIQLIRFFFHDGESSEEIKNKSDNAITGFICSRHRIGHGFKMGAGSNFEVKVETNENRKFGNLISDYVLYGCTEDVNNIVNYPVQKDREDKYIRKDAVPEPVIELCPISNYMLDYVNDFNDHPAIKLMEKGILAVICNDDPQIFDNPGLSYDYAVMYAALKKFFENKDKDKDKDKDKLSYKLLKLSAFLGFFYREMSRHYYKIEAGLRVVNDDMEIGDSSGSTAGSEYAIFNRAVEEFNEAWESYARKMDEQQTSVPIVSEG